MGYPCPHFPGYNKQPKGMITIYDAPCEFRKDYRCLRESGCYCVRGYHNRKKLYKIMAEDKAKEVKND
jgi:hypothetical protein